MSLRINNNIQSVNGHRNMVKNDMLIGKSLEKLSSGLKINRAADNAAGLIISEQMRAQLAGLNQAVENTEQAVNLVQTAEGALDEMNTLLSKARQLAIHAANVGVNDTNQLTADQSEINNIVTSITRIADNTQFGTKKVLDGSLGAKTLNAASVSTVTVGDSSSLTASIYDIEVSVAGVAASASAVFAAGTNGSFFTGVSANELSGGNVAAAALTFTWTADSKAYSLQVTAGTSLDTIVASLNSAASGITFSKGASNLGLVLKSGDTGTFANANTNLSMSNGTTSVALAASGAMAGGVDMVAKLRESGQTANLADLTSTKGFALTSTALGGTNVTLLAAANSTGTKSGVISIKSAVFQIGANAAQTASVALNSAKATDLGILKIGTTSYTLDSVRTSTMLQSSKAQEALQVIDKAIDDVTTTRGKLGSFQANTLETNSNSLRVTLENLTAAESTIRDVDFAKESANFTKMSILLQANTAMLAQANQLPQNVLKLLG